MTYEDTPVGDPPTPTRRALLRVYAALDREARANGTMSPDLERTAVPLDQALRDVLGIDVGDVSDVEQAVGDLAVEVDGERFRAASDDAEPLVPMVRITEALKAAVDAGHDVEGAVRVLLAPDARDDAQVIALVDALKEIPIAEETGFQDWTKVAQLNVHVELATVKGKLCRETLSESGREFPTKIDTTFEVERTAGGPDLPFDDLAWACMPGNWRHCNDFFCSVTHCPDREKGYKGATTHPPTSKSPYWRAVFEERVKPCPKGAFPNTFLGFTWRRWGDRQLILRYELAPRAASESCKLKVDEGWINLQVLADRYRVTTRKWLLFDDEVWAAGGQTLSLYACQLGWLDYSINQFTACAKDKSVKNPDPKDEGGSSLSDAQSRVSKVIDDAEARLRTRAGEVAADIDTCAAELRSGTFEVDRHVARAGRALVQGGGRDVAWAVDSQLDLGIALAGVLREALSMRGSKRE